MRLLLRRESAARTSLLPRRMSKAIFIPGVVGLMVLLLSFANLRPAVNVIDLLPSQESLPMPPPPIPPPHSDTATKSLDHKQHHHPTKKNMIPTATTITNETQHLLKQVVQQLTNRSHPYPPRKMSSTNNNVYFLHIGKAGGTSMDSLMSSIFRKMAMIQQQQQQQRQEETISNNRTPPKKNAIMPNAGKMTIPGQVKRRKTRTYVGFKHFDWKYIEKMQQQKVFGVVGKSRALFEAKTDVIIILRHPVSRGVSQFYFSKQLSWAKGKYFVNKTLLQYLCSPGGWRQPIEDGGSGVWFLAGTRGERNEEVTPIEAYLRKNKTAECLVAADRLDQTVYLALMEDLDRSMKLLQFTLDLDTVPTYPKQNKGTIKTKQPPPSDIEQKIIAEYVPADLWLYEYAKRLFEARYDHFINGNEYVHPELPPLPNFTDDDPLDSFPDQCGDRKSGSGG